MTDGSLLSIWSAPRCLSGLLRAVERRQEGLFPRVRGEHAGVVVTVTGTGALPPRPRGACLLTCGNYVNNRIVDSVSVPVHRVSSPN